MSLPGLCCTGYSDGGLGGLLLPPWMQGFSWNKLYRLDIIQALGLRFPNGMGTTEDVYFTYQYLSLCNRILHAPAKRVYHYYQRGNSATRSGYSPKKLETIRTYEKIIGDSQTRDPELAQTAADCICTTAVNLIWQLVNSHRREPDTMAYLRSWIRRTLPGYMRSTKYGAGRKLQAVTALLCPHFYALLKNMVQRRKGR